MNYKKLNEDKNELVTRAEKILNEAKENKKELSQEEINEVRSLHERAKKIDKEIKLREENENMIKEFAKDEETNKEEAIEKRSVEEIEKEDFASFLRGKKLNTRANLTNMTYSDNSAVVPKTIVNEIIKKIYNVSPILERCLRYNLSGDVELPYYPALNNTNDPATYDDISVAYINEFSDITSTTGKFGSISLSGYLMGALTKISLSLVNNSQFDIVNEVINQMAYRIGIFIEKQLLKGTENKITGLSTLSNSLTANSATAITADELISLKDMVKDQYQRDGIFIMSPATRTAIRLLKDQRGMYLFQSDLNNGFGDMLLGKPVYVSDNMDDMAASKVAIFYGDMTGLATNIREQVNIQILREHYLPQHAIGVVGFLEADSKVCNEQKIAELVMAAA